MEFGDDRVLARPLRPLQVGHSALQVLVLVAPEERTREREEGGLGGEQKQNWNILGAVVGSVLLQINLGLKGKKIRVRNCE